MVLLGTTPWWTHWKHEELFGNLTKTSWELSEENTLGTKKKKTQDIQQSPSPKERKTLTSSGFPNLSYLLGLINLYYNVKNIEFSEYTNAIIYAWLLCRWFHSFGLITKTKLTIDEETLANFIKQSTQRRGKGKGRNKEREREKERTQVQKPNPKWFVWFVLQLACVKCVLFMIDQKFGRIHAQLSSGFVHFGQWVRMWEESYRAAEKKKKKKKKMRMLRP
jgi:hypothetical protein